MTATFRIGCHSRQTVGQLAAGARESEGVLFRERLPPGLALINDDEADWSKGWLGAMVALVEAINRRRLAVCWWTVDQLIAILSPMERVIAFTSMSGMSSSKIAGLLK